MVEYNAEVCGNETIYVFSAEPTFSTVWVSVYITWCVLGFAAFLWVRPKHAALRARSPVFVLIVMILGSMHTFSVILPRAAESWKLSCASFNWLAQATIPCLILPWLVRAMIFYDRGTVAESIRNTPMEQLLINVSENHRKAKLREQGRVEDKTPLSNPDDAVTRAFTLFEVNASNSASCVGTLKAINPFRSIDESDVFKLKKALDFKRSVGACVVVCTPFFLTALISGIVRPVYAPKNGCVNCTTSPAETIVFSLEAIAVASLVLFVMRRVSKFADPWGVMYETKWALAGMLFFGITGLLFIQVDPGGVQGAEVNRPDLGIVLVEGTVSWVWLVAWAGLHSATTVCHAQIIFTLLGNRRRRKRVALHKEKAARDLKTVYANYEKEREVIELFERHLANEHTVEAIRFLDAVRSYRDRWDSMAEKLRASRARSIYDGFIVHDAPLQVNLPAAVTIALEETFETGRTATTKDMFDDSEAEVFKLLQADGWSRFLNSRAYRHYKSRNSRASTLASSRVAVSSRIASSSQVDSTALAA